MVALTGNPAEMFPYPRGTAVRARQYLMRLHWGKKMHGWLWQKVQSARYCCQYHADPFENKLFLPSFAKFTILSG